MIKKFDKISFFEKEYESEFIERDRINSNITNTITLFTLNLTILFYFISNIPDLFFPKQIDIWYIMFYLLLWCYIIYLIQVLINFRLFYFNNSKYMKFPYAKDVISYFDKLNYNEEYINHYLFNFYVDACTHNSKVNDYKTSIQFDIRKLLFIQFFLLSLLFIPYYIILDGQLSVYTVEIIKKGN
ncbi:hypothetical protein ACN9JU_06035 [Aliarcobacter butzleri]|uniref:hypothetical protein n=2 Tax=Aliarcobacter butzleri TaxID=28197 RepID=UPI000F49CFD5|nr:hypothetical protein [Aliarcobacter butzleri]MCT7552187.1 hypothetical protein [Aliarcobacter butzleri]